MKLKSFKIINDGLKGSIISYSSNKEVSKLTFNNDLTERHKAPVPSNLKDKLDKFKPYLLHICGYWVNEWDDYINWDEMTTIKPSQAGDSYFEMLDLFDKLDIIEVLYDGVNLKLEGKLRTEVGRKTISVKTPTIQATNSYEYFEEVTKLSKEFFSLAKSYVKGDLQVDAKQFAIDYYKSEGKEDEEINATLSEMSPEEEESFMREKLEGMGYIVMEDMGEVMEGVVEKGSGAEEDEEDPIEDIVEVEKQVAEVCDDAEEVDEEEESAEVVAEMADENEELPNDEFGFE